MGAAPIERYGLYGEPIRHVEPRFLHVEPIRLRSGHFAWRIDPHRHDDLHQLLLVTHGGGTMHAEGVAFEIDVPALLIIPAGVVHAFDFLDGTDGWVVSIAQTTLAAEVRNDGAIVTLFEHASCTNAVASATVELVLAGCHALAEELAWSAPARHLAIEGELLRLLAAVARAAIVAMRPPSSTEPDAILADRFRALVEQRFAARVSVSDYARDLGVSRDRLLHACRCRFERPPALVVHQRIVLEAQRWLIYTARPIAQIGNALGFDDPAYFSRFFKRHVGMTPQAYRMTKPR